MNDQLEEIARDGSFSAVTETKLLPTPDGRIASFRIERVHDPQLRQDVLDILGPTSDPVVSSLTGYTIGYGETETVKKPVEILRTIRLEADRLGHAPDIVDLARTGTPAQKRECRPQAGEVIRAAAKYWSMDDIAGALKVPTSTLYRWRGKVRETGT
jgi:hypothetical protein